MKKHNIFYLLFFSLFIGCTDESLNISRIDRANNAPPASVIGIDDELEAKKGIGMAYREQTWSSRIARLKPFWHYSWNRQLRDEIPDSVEYVPMFWGSGSVNDEEINKMVFILYLRNYSGISGSIYGGGSAIIVFMAFIYISSIILLIGAQVCARFTIYLNIRKQNHQNKVLESSLERLG